MAWREFTDETGVTWTVQESLRPPSSPSEEAKGLTWLVFRTSGIRVTSFTPRPLDELTVEELCRILEDGMRRWL